MIPTFNNYFPKKTYFPETFLFAYNRHF